jgi:hypothetical protein
MMFSQFNKFTLIRSIDTYRNAADQPYLILVTNSLSKVIDPEKTGHLQLVTNGIMCGHHVLLLVAMQSITGRWMEDQNTS